MLSFFPRFILFSAFYPFFRVLSLFPRFIPFSAFYPFFRVLSPFPRFIPFSAFYPFFRVLSLFPRFIPFSAFYPFFRVLSLFPLPQFSISVIPDPCFIPTRHFHYNACFFIRFGVNDVVSFLKVGLLIEATS